MTRTRRQSVVWHLDNELDRALQIDAERVCVVWQRQRTGSGCARWRAVAIVVVRVVVVVVRKQIVETRAKERRCLGVVVVRVAVVAALGIERVAQQRLLNALHGVDEQVAPLGALLAALDL